MPCLARRGICLFVFIRAGIMMMLIIEPYIYPPEDEYLLYNMLLLLLCILAIIVVVITYYCTEAESLGQGTMIWLVGLCRWRGQTG